MDDRISDILTSAAIETLERLAFIFTSPAEENNGLGSNFMSARVSFDGPFSGRLIMKMSQVVVLEMTGNMLGIDENEATIEEQSDAMKETINIICGNFLPIIGGNQAIFNINAPQIITEGNDEEGTAEAVAMLSFDEELCELYLFLDNDASL